jgi:hypothetical protein
MNEIQIALCIAFLVTIVLWRYRWFRVPAKIVGSIILTIVAYLISPGLALVMMGAFLLFIDAAEYILKA